MTCLTLRLAKADPTLSTEEIPDAHIEIWEVCPKFTSLEKAEMFYRAQARDLLRALVGCLPQGTRHALLVELLSHAPNLYRGK